MAKFFLKCWGDMTTNFLKIKNSKYYEQLYINELGNLDKVNKFLKHIKLTKTESWRNGKSQ